MSYGYDDGWAEEFIEIQQQVKRVKVASARPLPVHAVIMPRLRVGERDDLGWTADRDHSLSRLCVMKIGQVYDGLRHINWRWQSGKLENSEPDELCAVCVGRIIRVLTSRRTCIECEVSARLFYIDHSNSNRIPRTNVVRPARTGHEVVD